MVLNKADFLNSWKLLQTLWNALKTVLKWFATASATICVDLEWIPKGRKLADFEQKASAIAHGFEHRRFFELLEIVESLWNASITILKGFATASGTVCVNLVWLRKSKKIGRFWARGLGYRPWFWTCPILASPGNRSTFSETPPKPF